MGSDRSGFPSTAPIQDVGIPEEAVKDQLAKLLTSPEFARRPVLRVFLSFVVEKVLAGRAHEIKEYTVAIEVFGRKENFDASKDSIVRIQAGRLRRALERYYASCGGHDLVKIEIPRGSYVPTFQKLSAGEVGKGKTWPEWGGARPTESLGPTVAVLPLVNMTNDAEQEYFADGLTEELTHELARFQGLSVVASYSTMQLKNERAGTREMAQRLGVRFLLEGGVRRDVDLIKISVRLIDTATELQVWSEQYRRELKTESIIALQEEIAGKVAGKIGDLFGVISLRMSIESQKRPPDSLSTYDAFLRYFHYHFSLSSESFVAAFKALEDAVAEEPENGLAWSLLAHLHANNYALEYSRTDSSLDRATTMARKGVALDPGNQLAHLILAFVFFLRNERDSFFREAEIAFALNPNNPASISWVGWARALYGDWEPGLALLAKGMELNPHCPGWYYAAPYFDYFSKRSYPEALRAARQFNTPQLFWDPLLLAAALGQMGRELEAQAEVERLLALKPDFPSRASFLISLYAKSPSLIEAILDGLRKAGLKI
jgi:adenylate cyclase